MKLPVTHALDALRKLRQAQHNDGVRFLFELTSDTPRMAEDAASIVGSTYLHQDHVRPMLQEVIDGPFEG